MRQAISLRNISKVFGKTSALDGVSLKIEQGEIFGLLGLNGTGKTTILKCVMKLLEPKGGIEERYF